MATGSSLRAAFEPNRRSYYLRANLNLQGNVLDGALIATSQPEARFGNALSYWTEFARI